MKELELKEQIEGVAKQIDATWAAADKRFLELRTEIDRLKLEVISLKTLLKVEIPSFEERFSQIFSETMEEVSPE